MLSVLGLFFLFQEEDGIRDYKVTGVQTCALPIFHPHAQPRVRGVRRVDRDDARLVRSAASEDGDGFGRRLSSRDPRESRSEEHTSELQSPCNLVCRLLLEKKKKTNSAEEDDDSDT